MAISSPLFLRNAEECKQEIAGKRACAEAELHSLRTILSGMRHLEEAFLIFFARAATRPSDRAVRATVEAVSAWMKSAGGCVYSLDEKKILQLREETGSHGEVLLQIQTSLVSDQPAVADLDQSVLSEDIRMVAWALHRIAKMFLRLRDPASS